MLPRSLVGLAGSFLGDIDSVAREELLSTARLFDVRTGQTVYRDLSEGRIGVVLEGIVRAYIIGPDGRHLTTRYVRERSVVTTLSPLAVDVALPVGHEAVAPLSVIDLDFEKLLTLQSSNPSVVIALAAEATRRLADVLRTFAATYFGTVRDRVAALLLDTAQEERQSDGRLVVQVTQQELAVRLGTAREVVARVLQQLQGEGLVEIYRGGVRILDAHGMSAAAGAWRIPSRTLGKDSSGMDDSFDGAVQPVLAVDGSGAIVYANQAVQAVFGWKAPELVGRPITKLLPTPVAGPWIEMFSDFMETAPPGPIGLNGTFRGLRTDGTEFPAEITILPVRRGAGMIVLAAVVDLSYRDVLRARLAPA